MNLCDTLCWREMSIVRVVVRLGFFTWTPAVVSSAPTASQTRGHGARLPLSVLPPRPRLRTLSVLSTWRTFQLDGAPCVLQCGWFSGAETFINCGAVLENLTLRGGYDLLLSSIRSMAVRPAAPVLRHCGIIEIVQTVPTPAEIRAASQLCN